MTKLKGHAIEQIILRNCLESSLCQFRSLQHESIIEAQTSLCDAESKNFQAAVYLICVIF